MLDTADRLDLLDLYARYSHTFDGGRAAEWAHLFAPDGALQLGPDRTVSGTEDLTAHAEGSFARIPGIRHVCTNITVEAAPAGARGAAYVFALGSTTGDGIRMLAMGTYTDTFVRAEDGWRFQLRQFAPWTGPMQGVALLFPAT